MKVIIGSGKVSSILKDHNDVVLSHSEIEIKDLESIDKALSKLPVDTVVVNTAAKINLEWCESNKEEAELVNTFGAVNVGKICAKYGHYLVHVSSGCIFDGMETEKMFHETDEPSPASWYAETKARADKILNELGYSKILIVRPRQLISKVPHPTNMLTKFLSIEQGDFIDSKNSITCIEDMKDMINHLIKGEHYGIFNLANSGCISPYQIAVLLKDKLSSNMKINKVSYEDYVKTLKVKRVNTLLDISKLSSTGYIPRKATDALEWCIENYGINK